VPRILVEQDGSTLVNPRYIGEAALIGASSELGHVSGLRVSYNTLRLRYRSPMPQRILLNFNFDSNWTSSAGRIGEYEGLIAVDVDAASDREVVLTFKDPSFTAGVWLALFASLAYVGTFFGVRNWAWFRRERSTSG